MEREEFKILVKAMKAVYAQPTFIPDKDAFDVWYGLLQDLPYEQANLAIQKYMTSERFPPTIADIRTKATEIIAPAEESMSELQAWALVQRALRNSGYNSEEEFAKLPEACQRAVGTAANLKEWALMDSDQVATIEQSHFIRNYRTSVQRMKEEARLPENVRMLIADMGKKHAALMEKAADPQIEMQKIEVPEEKAEPPSGMSEETRKAVKTDTHRKRSMPQMRKTSITEWWFMPEMQGVSEKLQRQKPMRFVTFRETGLRHLLYMW